MSNFVSLKTIDQFEEYHSDNGGEFISGILKDWIESLGAKVIHGAPRHPQSQGQVERVNGTLKRKIAALQSVKPDICWRLLLDEATLCYNTTFHSTIQMTPWKVI